MTRALAILALLFIATAHAQGVTKDYSSIVNSQQVQDKFASMTKGMTPEDQVSVMCGNLKAYVEPAFGKVEFTRYSNGTLIEKFVCNMNSQNQRSCHQDSDLKNPGKTLTWVPCDQSCPPADWNLDSCSLKPEMQKAMYGRVLQPSEQADPYQ